MPEHNPGHEDEAQFTPAVNASALLDSQPESSEPVNVEPIELTPDDVDFLYRADVSARADAEDTGDQNTLSDLDARRKALMRDKGLEYGKVYLVKAGDRVYKMTTNPDDFGTSVEA